jgi:hypothetical protein
MGSDLKVAHTAMWTAPADWNAAADAPIFRTMDDYAMSVPPE